MRIHTLHTHARKHTHTHTYTYECKGKAVPLQAWSCPEGFQEVKVPSKKDKLNGIHMYIVTNTTICFVECLLLLRHKYMFRPSVLAIFRLYMRKLSVSYTKVCGEFTGCGAGGCEFSFVLEKRVWTDGRNM